jgi:adenylate cyclase class 2
MQQLEIEVKFYLSDVSAMRQRILGLGARSRRRYFERNIRYEDRNSSLIKKKSLLRLRQDRQTTLTYKYPSTEKNGQFKVLNELEVGVDDFGTMNRILESLGFHGEQIYEKWRETLVLGQTQFCMDAMPFGNFMEIEGPAERIRQYASDLKLDWGSRIVLNYLEIFEMLKKEVLLEFTDVTFKNFEAITIDFSNFLDRVQAGTS